MVLIGVRGGDTVAELNSLAKSLGAERDLAGLVRRVPGPIGPTDLGGALDTLSVALGSGGIGVALAQSLSVWLRTRRSDVKLTIFVDADGIRWNVDGHEREIRWDSIQRVRLTGTGIGARLLVWCEPAVTPPKPARRGPHGSYLLLQPAVYYGQDSSRTVNEHIRQALMTFAGDMYAH
ncbi:effector-associated constant component EACC1 [Actinospica robiniae]|uniref:effector-associated constant component EACC1 n=1 Tax=Actinospica robiniae TaxID=304901 RepID=UPI000429E976|nr:hypothetical protein [Actinospica robiniae]